MSRTKFSVAMALVASAALSVSLTGCFGEDDANPVTAAVDSSAKLSSYSKDGSGAALVAGAQADLVNGSFISVQEAFIITSGDKTAEDEAAIDVVFSASEDTASGIPTFYSPKLASTTTNTKIASWATLNSTIIVKTSKASSEITTVNKAKAEIGTATSQSAPAVNGGVYVIKTENGLYGMLEVTGMTAAGNASTVTLKIFNAN